MATNGSVVSHPSLPIFNGECYEYWSIKMKTLFKSQDLWDLVENGYTETDDEARVKENRRRDSKALFLIQQAVHESIFSRIVAAETSKAAWTILKTEFQGTSKVIAVKLQTLRQEFETIQMKGNESVQTFISRMVSIVNQMKTYGDLITDQTVAAKVLRSLTPRFDHVVAAIEEAKDLSILSIDELSGSLQAHEARLKRSEEKSEAQAFHMQSEALLSRGGDKNFGRGQGRSMFRGRGRGRGRGKSHIQCYNCNKFGHVQAECWFKHEEVQMAEENMVQEHEHEASQNHEDSQLF